MVWRLSPTHCIWYYITSQWREMCEMNDWWYGMSSARFCVCSFTVSGRKRSLFSVFATLFAAQPTKRRCLLACHTNGGWMINDSLSLSVYLASREGLATHRVGCVCACIFYCVFVSIWAPLWCCFRPGWVETFFAFRLRVLYMYMRHRCNNDNFGPSDCDNTHTYIHIHNFIQYGMGEWSGYIVCARRDANVIWIKCN